MQTETSPLLRLSQICPLSCRLRCAYMEIHLCAPHQACLDSSAPSLLLCPRTTTHVLCIRCSKTTLAPPLQVLVCPEKSHPRENKDKVLLGYTNMVDAWAMGILAFELIVGHPPFEKESRAATYEHIMYRKPSFPAWMTDEARDFITTALTKVGQGVAQRAGDGCVAGGWRRLIKAGL